MIIGLDPDGYRQEDKTVDSVSGSVGKNKRNSPISPGFH